MKYNCKDEIIFSKAEIFVNDIIQSKNDIDLKFH